jgi:hypothetical protein
MATFEVLRALYAIRRRRIAIVYCCKVCFVRMSTDLRPSSAYALAPLTSLADPQLDVVLVHGLECDTWTNANVARRDGPSCVHMDLRL